VHTPHGALGAVIAEINLGDLRLNAQLRKFSRTKRPSKKATIIGFFININGIGSSQGSFSKNHRGLYLAGKF
jgi:hypothetical protein